MEVRFRAAGQLRDQLGESSTIRRSSIGAWEKLQDFWREVKDFRNSRRDEGKEPGSFEDAIRWLERQPEREKEDPGFYDVAVILRPGTKARDTMRNREYDRFLLEN